MTLGRPLSFSIHSADGALLRTETLDQEIIKIGKLGSCHVLVDDESASRLHAVVEATDEAVTVIDLGSKAGTYVNGRKIIKAELQAGDELLIGATRVVVGSAGAPTPSSPKAAPAETLPPIGSRPSCPRCRLPLVPRTPRAEQAAVELCQSCGGLWLDRTLLRQVAQLPGVAAALRAIAEDAALRAPLGGFGGIFNVACPSCGTLMERRKHRRTGIVIDLCAEHGTWFDRGELRGVLDSGISPSGPFRSAPPGEEVSDPLPDHHPPAWMREGNAPPPGRSPLLLQLTDLLLDLGF